MASSTSICNMALAKIGSKRLNNLETDSSDGAIQCRLHYEQTRDSLLQSHYWRFASARASLSQDTNDPDFEYDNQFILPSDLLYLKSVYSGNGTTGENLRYTIAIEGERLLTNESEIDIRYIKRITDESKFSPLFTEVLVLMLALKLISLAGANPKLMQAVQTELRLLMPAVRANDRQETNTVGRLNRQPWVSVRVSGGSSWRQSRV